MRILFCSTSKLAEWTMQNFALVFMALLCVVKWLGFFLFKKNNLGTGNTQFHIQKDEKYNSSHIKLNPIFLSNIHSK